MHGMYIEPVDSISVPHIARYLRYLLSSPYTPYVGAACHLSYVFLSFGQLQHRLHIRLLFIANERTSLAGWLAGNLCMPHLYAAIQMLT